MYAHKSRPPPIRRIKVCEICAVRVGAARADENGLDGAPVTQVLVKSDLHGFGISDEVEVKCA